MLLSSFVFAASSTADAAPCQNGYVAGVVPGLSAVDVPLDASPAVVIEQGNCGSVSTYSATLLDADGLELASGDSAALVRLIELPAPGFSAGDTYSLHVVGGVDTLVDLTSTFVAGDANASVLGIAPAFVEQSFSWTKTGPDVGSLSVTVDAAPGLDPTGMAVLGLSADGMGSTYAVPTAGDNLQLSLQAETPEPTEDVCAQLSQRDAVGTWTTVAFCDMPELYDATGDTGDTGDSTLGGDCGCASVNPTVGVLVTLLAALVSRRR